MTVQQDCVKENIWKAEEVKLTRATETEDESHSDESSAETWQGKVSDALSSEEERWRSSIVSIKSLGHSDCRDQSSGGEKNNILPLLLGLMNWQSLLKAYDGAPFEGQPQIMAQEGIQEVK